MIVKCHKKSSRSTKISSLYLFDAIARHAGDIVRKQGQGFDARNSRAPKASSHADGTVEALIAGAKAFLSTAQLAAEELCVDTMSSVGEEQQVSRPFIPLTVCMEAATPIAAGKAQGSGMTSIQTISLLLAGTAWSRRFSESKASVSRASRLETIHVSTPNHRNMQCNRRKPKDSTPFVEYVAGL